MGMELVMLRDLGMLLQVLAFACLLVIQGSAVLITVSRVEQGKPGCFVYDVNVLISKAATRVAQPIE
ncbi:hypothetical protein SASPL_117617 [Salvia splendens]|uniref:Uncharacterized protein n=1 Tax=Salvia splendens TaxID=180675 RepID=A0A8X8Y029_SALSN|nr:hypothetical protein SASPL_117617 [Salvia splendens]